MKLSEWLDRQVDISAARHDADHSTASVVNINQTMLVDLIAAVKINDARLERIEVELGLPLVDLIAEGKTLRIRQ